MKMCMFLFLVAPVAVGALATDGSDTSDAAVQAASAEMFGSSAGVTPIQQVIKMMTKMKAKGIVEKKEEEVLWSEYWQWCQNEENTMKEEVLEGRQKMRELKARMDVLDREGSHLYKKIVDLKNEIANLKDDKKQVTLIRQRAAAAYTVEEKTTTESLAVMEDAIDALKKDDKITPQSEVFLQLKALNKLRGEPQDAISAFIEQAQSPDTSAMGREQVNVPDPMDPKAHGYEFQSSSVIDMLEKMQADFKQRLRELTRDESKSRHDYELSMQQLTAREKESTRQLVRLSTIRSSKQEERATAAGELKSATNTWEKDTEYLNDTKNMCAIKKRDFMTRNMYRKHEIEVLTDAIEILGSEDVTGVAKKYLNGLQLKKGTALGQLRSSEDSSERLVQVAAFLQGQAQVQRSELLSEVAQKVQATPFKKVLKMLKELMYKLSEEAAAEADDHGYCQAELISNEKTRTAKTESIAKLDAEIEDLEAEVAQLTEDLALLQSQIAEIKKSQREATAIRVAAKKKNKQTLFDAKVAQVSVQTAMAMLKGFYGKAAQSKAFAQVREDNKEVRVEPHPDGMGAGGPLPEHVSQPQVIEIKPEIVGGCATSEFGCCPGSDLGKADEEGTNCPKKGGCAGSKFGCCPGTLVAKKDADGANCEDLNGCALTKFGCCPDGETVANEDGSACEAHEREGDQPEIFDKAFKGAQAEGSSVMDFLEVILSDFMRLEQETNTQEAMEAETYKTFMDESDLDIATKSTELKYKMGTKTNAEKDLNDAKRNRAMDQEALDAALAYYDKLKPKCVDTGVSYEERKKRREDEIQAMTEALNILKGSDIAVR